MKMKQHTAFVFLWMAMLALLLHGIIPHHHHDSESEQCRIEIQHAVECQSCSHSVDFSPELDFCTDAHHSPDSHAHVCNFNSEKIKNVSFQLIAVIRQVLVLQNPDVLPTQITPYTERITTSPPPEYYSLRGPPLG